MYSDFHFRSTKKRIIPKKFLLLLPFGSTKLVRVCETEIEKITVKLPRNIWCLIFSYMEICEIGRLYTVCKKWKQMLDMDFHWKLRTQECYGEDEELAKQLGEHEKRGGCWKTLFREYKWKIHLHQSGSKQVHATFAVSPYMSVFDLFDIVAKSNKHFARPQIKFSEYSDFTYKKEFDWSKVTDQSGSDLYLFQTNLSQNAHLSFKLTSFFPKYK